MTNNAFKVRKGLIVNGSGSTVLDILGTQGELFSVTDDLSGSLFSVNDISGIPIMEVFSDDTINMGTFGAEALTISGSTTTIVDLNATGSFSGSLASPGSNGQLLYNTGSIIAGSGVHYDDVNDRVGIGTTSPIVKLDVEGDVRLSDGGSRLLNIQALFAGGTEIRLEPNITAGFARINVGNTNSPLDFQTNSVTVMRLNQNGNVGIGTTSPSGKLAVNQDVSNGDTSAFGQPHLKLAANNLVDNTGYVGLTVATSTSDNFGYSVGAQRTSGGEGTFKIKYHNSSIVGVDRFVLLQSGNVGIGTASPSDKLHLSNADALSLIIERTGAAPSLAALRNEAAQLKIETNGTNGIAFLTGTGTPAEKVRINTSGNVGINVTNPLTRFHNVLSSAGTIAWSPLAGTSAIFESGTSNRNFVNIVAPSNGQSELWFGNQNDQFRGRVRYDHSNDSLALWTSSTERLRITSAGNVGIGTTTPGEKLEVDGNIGTITKFKQKGDQAGTPLTYNYSVVDDATDIIGNYYRSRNRLIVAGGFIVPLATDNDQLIFTLPVGFRPNITRRVVVGESLNTLIINTNGEVRSTMNVSDKVYLDFEITLDLSQIDTY